MQLWDLFVIAISLSADAFAIATCKGLRLGKVKPSHMLTVGLYFGIFQAFMPLTGWVCIKTVLSCFQAFEKLIPWIALALLGFINV